MQLRIFKPTNAYGDQLNSYDLLKLIALATMVVDHLGAYVFTDMEPLRVIGRTAFPLFLFLVGYSINWKVRWDLIAWGVALLLFTQMIHRPLLPFNILISIAVTRFAMPFILRKELTPKYLTAIFLVCVVWYPLFLWIEYSTLALLFALCGTLQRQKPEAKGYRWFLYATLVLHFVMQWYDFRFSVAGILLLIPVAVLTGYIILKFRLQPITCNRCPAQLRHVLQWAARNTLPLYALHVMVLMGVEKMLFPWKFLHFSWF